jgi:hypothetical protein
VVRPDATYVITGGFGDLGLATAEMLHAAGARHLVLIGRRTPGAAASERLARLRADGTVVTEHLADVADPAELAGVLDECADLPPIAGVLHLAGCLDDGVLLLQSEKRLAQVLGPKAGGAWNLHLLTRDLPLDFFVLFSSVSGLLGTPGQAGYASANAFLDGLAEYRRALGLPGLAIQWGSWARVGMSARAGLDARLTADGEGVIPPAQGLAALRALLAADTPDGTVAVLPASWHRFARRDDPALVGILADLPGAADASPVVDLAGDPLADCAPDERRDRLVGHVLRHAGAVLGHGSRPASDGDLFAAGMDSLTAIELRRNLQRSLRMDLKPTVLFDHRTAERLAEHIVAVLDERATVAG